MLSPSLTREQTAAAFECSVGAELGQLLRHKVAPLPVRVGGAALWYADEVERAKPAVAVALKRYRERRGRR